ncbi:hypothetical protein [Maribacter sp. 2307ULW6-5]|uniref:hypothetical protein n=1 Tax=Maribacter sp. 2307ULW6-5 TaxID=3386275 RepID=UPI0039BC8F7E
MNTLKSLLVLLVSTTLLFTSCRTEDEIIIDPPTGETLNAGSTLANLLNRTALNDGSKDNILDNASCISIALPIDVTVNGNPLTINDEDGYEEVEDIFDDFDNDTDVVVISYPITIIKADYSRETINSDDELLALAATCPAENELDDDIECIDFKYPITASVFNQNNEVINTIIINSDNEMYNFVDDLDDFAAVTIDFPITVILADGSELVINTIQELQREIELADDSCDEDDDYDYNDDDCDNCTTAELEGLFADCTVWRIEDLERNDTDLDAQYNGYTFSFNADGTLSATEDDNTQSGTWSATGTGNAIDLSININGLTDLNGTWNLEEIEREDGEVEFELFLGEDELSFSSSCGTESNSGDALSDTLTAANAVWTVSSFVDEGDNETASFNGFELTFSTTGSLSAQNGNNTTNGTWSSRKNGAELEMDFDTENILDELDEDWKVVSVSATEIRLEDIDEDNGNVEATLTLSRQ